MLPMSHKLRQMHNTFLARKVHFAVLHRYSTNVPYIALYTVSLRSEGPFRFSK